MNEPIRLILSLSLSGSILAVSIFALKPLTKQRLPKSFQYYLWLIVLIRLIMPFSFAGSIMNNLFTGSAVPAVVSVSNHGQPPADDVTTAGSTLWPTVQEKVSNGVYNQDTDHSRYLHDLIGQDILYIWLLGILVMLSFNLWGYIRFAGHLRRTNLPAEDEDHPLLSALLRPGQPPVRLFRSPYAATPMLVGMIRPYILIPDKVYSSQQLKNIFLHELTHLRRGDIAVKWLTMIAVSLHWFNPLIYLIRKEINHACELACDEAVISRLTAAEKQVYGDTLIAVVAETAYPFGVLQATMCEEKKSLQERLSAIMLHRKKSSLVIAVSAVLLAAAVLAAVTLGACGLTNRSQPAKDSPASKTNSLFSYDLEDIARFRTPYVGSNSQVSGIVSRLPLPDSCFDQQYIALETKNKPYGLTVFYEPKPDAVHSSEWPIVKDTADDWLSRNALVLFCMIDNLDQVTFAFRDSVSGGKLETDQYDSRFAFSRPALAEKYGDLSLLGQDLNALQQVLAQ